jgi:hypothetical protein
MHSYATYVSAMSEIAIGNYFPSAFSVVMSHSSECVEVAGNEALLRRFLVLFNRKEL